MKLAIAIAAAIGCSHPRASPLANDVKAFCGAWEAAGRPRSISDFSESLAAQLQSPEMIGVFAAIPAEGDAHLFEKLRALVGATPCPTLDWMEQRYAR